MNVLEHCSDGIVLLEPEPWRIVYANASWTEWVGVGCKAGADVGLEGVEELFNLEPGLLSARLDQVWQGDSAADVVGAEFAISLPDEAVLGVELRILRIELGNRPLGAVVIRWPTLAHGQPAAQRRDPLTGLADRSYLWSRLDVLLGSDRSADQRFAVLFVDLDGFKAVNDRHGHLAGDRVLVEVGQRLATSVRKEDRVVRYGGDEFVVLVEQMVRSDEAEQIVERIRQALAPPISLQDGEIHMSASIGVAEATPELSTADSILAAADRAMYAAKRSGSELCESGG